MNKRKSLSNSNSKKNKKRKSLFLNTDDYRDKKPSSIDVSFDLNHAIIKEGPKESTPAQHDGTPPKLNIQRRRGKTKQLLFAEGDGKAKQSEKKENVGDNSSKQLIKSPETRSKKILKPNENETVSGTAESAKNVSLLIDYDYSSKINESDLLYSETITSKTLNENKSNSNGTNKERKFNCNTRSTDAICNDIHHTPCRNRTNNLAKSNAEGSETLQVHHYELEGNIRDESLLNCLNSPINVSFNNNVLTHQASSSLLGHASKDDAMFANLELTQMERETKTETFYGLPVQAKEMFVKHRGILKLYDWQDECLRLKAIDKRKNLVYSLPTSGGKTLVAEILMLKEILVREKNVILVLPYVSIVQEKVRGLSPFAVDLNFHIEEYAAGKGSFPPKKRKKKKSIYIATIEKANAILNSFIEEDRNQDLGMIVVDELHMIGEGGGRGALLEILLTKVMFKSPGTQIIGMSATLGNMNEIKKFLNAEVYSNNFRPVELTEHVKIEDCVYVINTKPKYEEDLLKFSRKVTYPKGLNPSLASRDPDQLISLVLEVIPHHSCLIFCPTKKNCESVGVMVAKSLPKEMLEVKKEERKTLLQVLHKSTNGVCKVLSETIPYGIAYHHSGLTLDERELIEEAYSSGLISLLCCTSTLAAGVNLPARRVILRSPYVGNKFLSRSQYKQMVGRAGRAGIDTTGESILILQQKDKLKSQSLFDGPITNCQSSLFYEEGKGVRELILSLLGLKICSCESEIENFLQLTLFHIQRSSVEGHKELKCIKKEVEQLTQLGLVTNNVSKDGVCILRTTNLGNATLKSCMNLDLAPFVYNQLKKGLEAVVLANELHLLYLVTPLDQVHTVRLDWMIYYELVDKLNEVELKACQFIGISQDVLCRKATAQRVPKGNFNEFIYKRFYLTLIIRGILRSRTLWDVADVFNESRGFLQNLFSSTMSFMSNMMHFCEQITELWAFKLLFQALSTRVTHAKNAELAVLMEIPGVKQGRAMQLFKNGFRTLQHVAHAEPKTLTVEIENLSRRQAELIVCSAKMILKEKIEALKEEADEIAAIPEVT